MKIRKITSLLLVLFMLGGTLQVMGQQACAVITNPVISFDESSSTPEIAVVDFEFDANFNSGSKHLVINFVDADNYAETVISGGEAPVSGNPPGFTLDRIRGIVGIDNTAALNSIDNAGQTVPVYNTYDPDPTFNSLMSTSGVTVEVTGTITNPHYVIKGIQLHYPDGYTLPLDVVADVWASQAGPFKEGTKVHCAVTEVGLTVDLPLPILLSEFSAVKSGNVAQLNWTTATEQDNSGFDIERSADGQSWQPIGQVATKAPAGNSAKALNYRYTDEQPLTGINYYRLKQTDLDGRYSYSEVRTLTFDASSNITLYPNPVQNLATVKGLQGTETITVFDASGRQVIRQKASSRQAEIDFSRIPKGVYHVRVDSKEGKVIRTLSVVKAK